MLVRVIKTEFKKAPLKSLVSLAINVTICSFFITTPLLPSPQMFPWSAVFSLEPKVPGRRSSEELVTNTLMLELGAIVKRTERIRLERVSEGRRRRSSASSAANYSWLATAPAPAPYELTPGDLLELQELCSKVLPSQCGPLIVR